MAEIIMLPLQSPIVDLFTETWFQETPRLINRFTRTHLHVWNWTISAIAWTYLVLQEFITIFLPLAFLYVGVTFGSLTYYFGSSLFWWFRWIQTYWRLTNGRSILKILQDPAFKESTSEESPNCMQRSAHKLNHLRDPAVKESTYEESPTCM